MTYRYWTKQEIDFLRRNVGIIPFSKIGKKLNRSVGSVGAKASRLKLKSALHGRFENEMNPNWHGGHFKECEVCKKKFWVQPSTEDRRFCSAECYYSWVRENSVFKKKNNPFYNRKHSPEALEKIRQSVYHLNLHGTNNPNWKGGHYKKCEVCGKEFWVIPSRENASFCSRECKGKAHSKAISGENHPRYGKNLSKALREKISKGVKQAWEENPELWRHLTELHNKQRGENHPRFGIKLSEELRGKIAHGVIEAYKRGAYEKRPTDIEGQFMLICRKYNLPYRYTGDGSFWVSNMNPDFIHNNGKKIAVEILGVFWHTEQEWEERKKKFEEHSWKAIGIWGDELRNLPDQEIVNKVVI